MTRHVTKGPTGKSPDIDGGWAFVIAGAAWVANAILSGMYFSFSMYFVVILNEFHSSRALTAWIGSLNNSLYMMGGPIASLFIIRFGTRKTIMIGGCIAMVGFVTSSIAPNIATLFITYGVVTALGLCLSSVTWVVAISDFFQEKYAVVFSLTQSGVGVGVFVFGPLFSYMIATYGWRGALLITGGCAFQLTALGALILSPRKPVTKQLEDTEEDSPLTKVVLDQMEIETPKEENPVGHGEVKPNDGCVWAFHVCNFFWLLATSILYILMADFTRSKSLDEYYIYMLSCMGVGDLIGRTALGPMLDYFKLNVIKVAIVSQLLCTLSLLSFGLVFDGIQMIVQGWIFSVTYGCQCVLLALIPRFLCGSQNLNKVLGITLFFGGAGVLVGSPVAGLLVDATGSYLPAFFFSATMEFIAMLCAIGCLYKVTRKAATTRTSDVTESHQLQSTSRDEHLKSLSM